jgi:hypothetical protein
MFDDAVLILEDAPEDNSRNRVLGAGDDRDLGLIRFHNALLVCVRRLSRTTHFLGSRLIPISVV